MYKQIQCKKYILLFIFGICLYYFIVASNIIYRNYADSTQKYYAQVTNSSTSFYSSANEGSELFCIPYSYYVEITDNANNGYYPARYNNISGFVKSASVQCVSDQPSSPFAMETNFRILATQSAELRTEPSRLGGNSTLICQLPLYETNFTYYGTKQGEEVVSLLGEEWFYCAYTYNNTNLFGYVYAGLCYTLSTSPIQTISTNVVTAHVFNTEIVDPIIESPELQLPSLGDTITILAIGLPALVIFVMLLRQSTKKVADSREPSGNASIVSMPHQPPPSSRNSEVNKPRIPKHRGKDYYEL